jgi:hypothetical protein
MTLFQYRDYVVSDDEKNYPCNILWRPIGLRRRCSHIFSRYSAQMTVRLSASRAGHPLPPEKYLVLISLRSWVDPRIIMRLEGLGQLKNPPHGESNPRPLACSIVAQPTTLPQDDKWMAMNSEGSGWKGDSLIKEICRHFPGQTEENYDKLCQDIQCFDLDSNRAPHKYKSRPLSLDQHVRCGAKGL